MKTATLQDLSLLRRYMTAEPRRLCTYTPALLVMWRDYFHLALREENDTLTVRLSYDGGRDAYLYPMGSAPERAVSSLWQEAQERGESLLFAGLDDRDRDRLLAVFPTAKVTSDRGEADYLYRTEELAAFPGKRFGGQRNHVNKFDRLFPDHSVTDLAEGDLPELFAFLDGFAARHAARPLLAEELDMTREVLTHYGEYGMDGVVLRAEGRIAAFAAGEVVGDMLAVHIEKADTSFPGAYQKIVSAFARRYDPITVPYLNREDDMNDEGLRKSKLSYHPVAILDKWRVEIG